MHHGERISKWEESALSEAKGGGREEELGEGRQEGGSIWDVNK